jgi:hypothetical protein
MALEFTYWRFVTPSDSVLHTNTPLAAPCYGLVFDLLANNGQARGLECSPEYDSVLHTKKLCYGLVLDLLANNGHLDLAVSSCWV